MTEERRVMAKERAEDKTLDLTLRPRDVKEFVGQDRVLENLNIFIGAAKQRKEPVEHVLLHGAPGLGKTTLAHIIAREMNANLKVTSGPAVEKAGDLAAILTNLSDGDVFFIDEIHRLNRIIEEILYPAMEDYFIDIVVGKGPSARTLKLDLPKFTLIGATTRLSLLSSPLRDRFGMTYRLGFYEDLEIEKIIHRSAKILGVTLDKESSKMLSERARKTPRVANRLLKRVRDYAQVKSDGKVTKSLCEAALAMLDIDEMGLDDTDRKILEIIIEKYKGGPVGVNAIAAGIQEEMETIEDIYEPYLMQIGYLVRTPRGRSVTEEAYKHLSKPAPRDLQKKLV